MSLLALFGTFASVGLFTIGGGLVAITVMYKPIVEGGLISAEMFYNMVAISESTPGPIGINMATYVGFELYGIPGAVIATAGTVLPSLIITMIVAKYFIALQEKPLVRSAFSTLRPAVTGMVASATVQVFLIGVIKPGLGGQYLPTLFFIVALSALFKTTIHPVLLIAAGAAFGVVCL